MSTGCFYEQSIGKSLPLERETPKHEKIDASVGDGVHISMDRIVHFDL